MQGKTEKWLTTERAHCLPKWGASECRDGGPHALQGPTESYVDSVVCLSQVQMPHPDPLNPPLPDPVARYGHFDLLHGAPPHPRPKSWPHSSVGLICTCSGQDHFFLLLPKPLSNLAPHGPTQERREHRARALPASGTPQIWDGSASAAGHFPCVRASQSRHADMAISVGEIRERLITKHYFLDYKMGVIQWSQID